MTKKSFLLAVLARITCRGLREWSADSVSSEVGRGWSELLGTETGLSAHAGRA